MKKIILPILILSTTIFLGSCTKQGCIDSTANNYNSNANSTDNSCVYGEKLILWQSQSSAQDQLVTGVTAIKWYIDGQYVGSHAASEYSTNAPTCSTGGSQLNTTISLGSSKTKTIQLEAKDQNNDILGTEYLIITAGSCSIQEF